MTFFTAPMLSAQTGFIVPVPQETGYSWDWITLRRRSAAAAEGQRS